MIKPEVMLISAYLVSVLGILLFAGAVFGEQGAYGAMVGCGFLMYLRLLGI